MGSTTRYPSGIFTRPEPCPSATQVWEFSGAPVRGARQQLCGVGDGPAHVAARHRRAGGVLGLHRGLSRDHRSAPVFRTIAYGSEPGTIASRLTWRPTIFSSCVLQSSPRAKYFPKAQLSAPLGGVRARARSTSLSGVASPVAQLPKSQSSRTQSLLLAHWRKALSHSSRISSVIGGPAGCLCFVRWLRRRGLSPPTGG